MATATRIKLESEYLSTHANMLAMVENLQEFIANMPAPNDDNEIPASVNWAVLGSYKHVEAMLIEASRAMDEIK